MFELANFFRQDLNFMYFRPAILILSAMLLLAAGTGCKKSESRAAAPPTVLPPNTIASLHWLGKRQLGYEATAFFFMRVWNHPETLQLEKQSFDRLATVPERFFPGGANLMSPPGSLALPLIYDLQSQESYIEIRAATNAPPAFVFAIRLTDITAVGGWFTNLSYLLEPLAGGRVVVSPVDHSWSLKTTNSFQFVELSRVGDWTMVAAGPEQNPLADEITARIRRDGVPFVSAGTNLWLEASLDLPRLEKIFPLSSLVACPARTEGPGEAKIFSALNHFDLTISGDGANVITRGKLTFSRPFAAPLEAWRLPVDLMHEPLTSFTAMRGLPSSLRDWQPWRDLEIGAAPDQLCFWSLAGSPYQIYLAAPLPDARSQVAVLSGHLLQKGNPWLAANGYIGFDRAHDANGVTWGNLPGIEPFIKSAGAGAEGWLFAGLLPDTNTDLTPPPAGMINDVLRRTNLVYYDWEVTGPRLQPVLQLGQTARQIARRPQMVMDSPAIGWLGLLIPRLGTSATIASRTGAAELTFYRRSTLGFNAIELHLLADWLESPAFPRGLHSW
jgi:hypothetical protein